MDMMLLCINTFFHVSNQLVYPIFSSQSHSNFAQEDNDQAFPVTR
jgi:hypothetical protein